jgi:hypothetical protein
MTIHPFAYERLCKELVLKRLKSLHPQKEPRVEVEGKYPETKLLVTLRDPREEEEMTLEFELWGPEFEVPRGWQHTPEVATEIITRRAFEATRDEVAL